MEKIKGLPGRKIKRVPALVGDVLARLADLSNPETLPGICADMRVSRNVLLREIRKELQDPSWLPGEMRAQRRQALQAAAARHAAAAYAFARPQAGPRRPLFLYVQAHALDLACPMFHRLLTRAVAEYADRHGLPPIRKGKAPRT